MNPADLDNSRVQHEDKFGRAATIIALAGGGSSSSVYGRDE